jgi:hypothetical protein
LSDIAFNRNHSNTEGLFMHIRPHRALRVVLLSALAGTALPLAHAAEPAKPAEAAKAAKGPESGKTQTVKNLGVKMTVPESWKSHATNSNFHLMQFSIPKMDGDKDDTVVSVWYFGLNGAAGIHENFQRWIDEFSPKDRKLKVTTGKCPAGDYLLLDISGTWDRDVPRKGGGSSIVRTTGREIAVAVTAAHAGDYFYRLMGTDQTVAANVDAFRAAIGADAKTEKESTAFTKVTAKKPVGEQPAAAQPKAPEKGSATKSAPSKTGSPKK